MEGRSGWIRQTLRSKDCNDHFQANCGVYHTTCITRRPPRYLRTTSTNPFGRTAHALAITLFDKTDSGRSTVAVSNFAAAAAGGFVGMGFYPDGYNDATHAGQRAAAEFGTIALGHVIAEYEPEWGPWAKKIHLPKLLPAWWVPEH